MNKDEYYHQRNIVRDKSIPPNHISHTDSENSKSQSPGLSFRNSNVHDSIKHSQNFEQLYVQEQQSKRMIQNDKENLERSLQKMIENKKEMERQYEEYLKIVQDEKSKYQRYEEAY